MRVDVIMPQMGESIAEGTLTKWLKKAGDKVARDEPIFEISTDKVDAEIPSPAAGVLAAIKVSEGQTVPINTIVALIETEAGAAVAAEAPAPAAKAAPAPAAKQAPAPAPAAADVAASPRPAAPPARPAAPASGGPVEFPKASDMAAAGAGAEEIRRVRSSPVVRKIASEHQIDIGQLEGTGSGGRVSKKDILAALESGVTRAAAPGAAARPAAASAAAQAPAYAPGERVSIVPMTTMRKRIAEHMILSRRTSAHVTTVFEVDMHRTMQLRAAKRQAFEERNGVRLTVTPLLVRAAVDALKAYPVMNSSIDGESVVYKRDINIGVAVALDWGLIVPVVKNADDLSLSGIAKAVNDLADRARAKKLTPDEVQGGTFTITNPGIFGALFGTPIINQPQVGIMGVGAIVKRPVVIDDAIAIHPMVHITLSFDHRLIDGAVADQFLAHVKATLEEARFPELG
ncbi:MAG TPA: 2-oxoglutarate dehydrogenase, E2 component, dihydrolipoamide succinyltransferase [Patescibacteria group bacterium]|nr:2-oxoglutarate dehydrogenase, E2 component, dihydrolipoamide succinyltransferase [Patescibacteria group bacterium]